MSVRWSPEAVQMPCRLRTSQCPAACSVQPSHSLHAQQRPAHTRRSHVHALTSSDKLKRLAADVTGGGGDAGP